MRFFSRPEMSVLMVCSANICRSPMAEGVMRFELLQLGLQNKVQVDSAGTHASQAGRAPDPRAQRVCSQNGIDIRKARARQVSQKDFETFNHILAMDARNYEWLIGACPEPHKHKISLVGHWAGHSSEVEIPDPYYGNEQGFAHVLSLLQTAIAGFVAREFSSLPASAGK